MQENVLEDFVQEDRFDLKTWCNTRDVGGLKKKFLFTFAS
jgi:hypothetical protein